jgi:hypothetical protein
MTIYDSAQFIDMLDLSIADDKNSTIDFNDEIISIEYIGEQNTYDIDITGNHLYFANDILTHNSAVNNVDASNDSVSDSIGTIMTADFIVFLLQNEQMKEENLITCKVTKNRFTGRTDQWDMNIDYEHMRFNDLLVQTGTGMTSTEVNSTIESTYRQDLVIMKENDMTKDEEFDILAELGL